MLIGRSVPFWTRSAPPLERFAEHAGKKHPAERRGRLSVSRFGFVRDVIGVIALIAPSVPFLGPEGLTRRAAIRGLTRAARGSGTRRKGPSMETVDQKGRRIVAYRAAEHGARKDRIVRKAERSWALADVREAERAAIVALLKQAR